jgi:CDP-diacylglycerol--glycerol-3-phosphate 3-phosphatidyltransferase
LSLSRVIAAAPIAALILSGGSGDMLAAAIVFGLAAITDLLDGPLARHTKTVGPLGVYLDTTGDKVLVSTVLVALTTVGLVPAWMTMVIIGREFLVTGIRTLASIQGVVVTASLAGKAKTLVTMTAMGYVLLAANAHEHGVVSKLGFASSLDGWSWYCMLAGTLLTIFSGLEYLRASRTLFSAPESPLPEQSAHPSTVFQRTRESIDDASPVGPAA